MTPLAIAAAGCTCVLAVMGLALGLAYVVVGVARLAERHRSGRSSS